VGLGPELSQGLEKRGPKKEKPINLLINTKNPKSAGGQF